jgi:hypothetical protein
VDRSRLQRAYESARAALFAERTAEGHWIGELSTSALSTAVAISALALVQRSSPGFWLPSPPLRGRGAGGVVGGGLWVS